MTEKEHEEQDKKKSAEEKDLSEWQKLNKEYREKKAQEEAEKERTDEEAIPSSDEAIADEKEIEDTDDTVDDNEQEDAEDEQLDLIAQKKRLKKEKKQAKQAITKEKIGRRHLYRSIPIFLFSFLCLILAIYFMTPYSKLKDVKVTGNQEVSAEEIVKLSQIQSEDYTLTTYLNQKQHARHIQDGNLWVDRAELVYQFPITFTIKIKEYPIVAYSLSGEQHFPVLASGEEVPTPVEQDHLPEKYILLQFSDKPMLRSFVQQFSELSSGLQSMIDTIQHTPSKATADLLTITMVDGHKVIVPLSELAKKLPYYEKIKNQLTELSTVDMEAGAYSYATNGN